MKPSNISILPFFFSMLINLTAPTTLESFLECLETNSQPSYPISTALYSPQNSSFSSILQSYMRNQRFNEPTTPKPLLILTALHVSHIQSAIICAKSHILQVRIRSGGHDFEGVSCVSNEPFFILDMFNLRKIYINVDQETAWVETGATLGELYYTIAEKSNIHTFPAGTSPTVGVGGLISGGGFGNLMRKYGLAADNVMDAKLIDVNGSLLDRESMGEDLFWAITGGGGSSFGVVLSYKIRLVRVPAKVTFAGIRIINNYNKNLTDIVVNYLQVVHKLHEDLYVKLTIDVVGKKIRGKFRILFLGDSQVALDLMKESFPELGLSKADCVEVSYVDSIVLWNFPKGTPTSALLSRTNSNPIRMKRTSDFVKDPISKKGIKFLFKKLMELNTVLKLSPYGGIMNYISPSAKPFPHRSGNIVLIEIATNWNETGTEAANYYVNLTRKMYQHLTPFVSKSREAYLNYRDFDLGINHNGVDSYSNAAKTYGFKYFKNNFEKLVEIKSKVDPDNFFRNEQSIPVLPFHTSIAVS